MPRTVLFLCTGNYYRSRFAESLFNHLAAQRRLPWRAESRGLATELARLFPGPISPDTVEGLRQRGVRVDVQPRQPLQCCPADLSSADIVIALKEAEHRPLLRARHLGWEDRCRYWHVHDVDGAEPEQALSELGRLVGELLDELTMRGR